MATVEIETNERSERIRWVTINSTSDEDFAYRLAVSVAAPVRFTAKTSIRPHTRVLNSAGEVVWDSEVNQ